MKKIPLTKGRYARIDDVDFERVAQIRWSTTKSKSAIETFYAISKVGKKTIYLHRFILEPTDKETVDHINGDGLDNRRENLRICTQSQNLMRQRKTRGKSKYKGVWKHQYKDKWCADIKANGVRHRLGIFKTEKSAAKAYDEKAKEIHGVFARLNFPV